jgi:NAD(P)-dependent dehydrogenase (short-subunit alcohol dehydrogenase family)
MNEDVVLVTGGAGNLGRAVTRAFLEQGARVAVPFYKTDQPTALDTLGKRFPDALNTFALDLTTERGSEQAVRQTVEWGGRLSAVVHLVGGYNGGFSIAETPLEVWNRMVELNMTSAYLIARFALPHFLEAERGTFVFVSSRAAFEGRASQSAYATTKAGLITFAKVIAEEYGDSGIRSNVIVPDTIDTEANRNAMPNADHSRFIDPDAIARVIVFLTSAGAGAINGAAVPIYGQG